MINKKNHLQNHCYILYILISEKVIKIKSWKTYDAKLRKERFCFFMIQDYIIFYLISRITTFK